MQPVSLSLGNAKSVILNSVRYKYVSMDGNSRAGLGCEGDLGP